MQIPNKAAWVMHMLTAFACTGLITFCFLEPQGDPGGLCGLKKHRINAMKGMGWNKTWFIEWLVSKILLVTSYYYNLHLASLPLNFQLPVNPPLQGGPEFQRCGGGGAFGWGPAASGSCIWWGWGWEVADRGVCGCLEGAPEFRVDERQICS